MGKCQERGWRRRRAALTLHPLLLLVAVPQLLLLSPGVVLGYLLVTKLVHSKTAGVTGGRRAHESTGQAVAVRGVGGASG